MDSIYASPETRLVYVAILARDFHLEIVDTHGGQLFELDFAEGNGDGGHHLCERHHQ